MAVRIADTLGTMGAGGYPLLKAADAQLEDGTTVEAAIKELQENSGSGGITEIPIASATTLGGIKVGNNLTISADGTLNAQAGGSSESGTVIQNGEVFSEEETIIGCWTNGKPIYRKVVSLPNTTTSGSYTHVSSLDISALDVETPLSATGTYKCLGNDKQIYSAPRVQGAAGENTGLMGFSFNQTTVVFKAYAISGECGEITAILEYTKTTDAENSFTNVMLTDGSIDLEATDEELEEVFG